MAAPEASAYPRPDWVRSQSWVSLNGLWDIFFDDQDIGLLEHWQHGGLPQQGKRTIQVPYVFQCPASGINEQAVHEVLWYERPIVDPRSSEEAERQDRVLLRFGAVDYEATVWVDGHLVGEHRGGHVPFDLDVTDALLSGSHKQPHRLTLRVFDSATDVTQPRGKQYWGPKPESIFYTPSSGIWQDVWLESVPHARIADSSSGTILRSDDIEGGELHALVKILGRRAGQKYSVEIEASFGGYVVATTPKHELPNTKRVQVDLGLRLSREHLQSLPDEVRQRAPLDNTMAWLNGLALWSPEHPQLYDLIIRLFDAANTQIDEVRTTTGMRSISWNNGDSTFRLNGHPYFQSLFLDQGYWPDTLMTPPSQAALKTDIELTKAIGFNGCRKHQKVEDPAFMYWADRLGLLVWGEMASPYKFSKEHVERFDEEWMAMVQRDINHPCIVAWTPVNESWGHAELERSIDQRHHIRSMYYRTKTLDPTRPINDNCGWEHVTDDLTTFHDYADDRGMSERCESLHSITTRGRAVFLPPIPATSNAPGDPGSKHRPGAPVICTEFGGVNIALGGKDANHERGWGYTSASDPEDLLIRIEKLCQAVVNKGQCCGFVWTQLTDIEQETNGMYTYDRQPKLDVGRVRQVIEGCARTYLAYTANATRDMSFRGGLRDSCRNIRLEDNGRFLVAECAIRGSPSSDADYQTSRLDLNDCLTNSWGKLSWARDGNFHPTAQNLRLGGDGLVLEAEAGDGKGWVANQVRLEEGIRNNGGQLAMVAYGGQIWASDIMG